MANKYSDKNIKKINKAPYPRVLLNVCTHGTEKVGLKVADYFKNFKPIRGTFVVNIANKKAISKNKRFIDQDLNRVFPGKKRGDHEETLAYKLAPFVRAFDVVVDIHSTETGSPFSIIITDFNDLVGPILKAISPQRVIHMKATKSNALISEAKVGIGFEYGKDKDPKTYKETVRGVERLLAYHGMLVSNEKNGTKPIEFYEAKASVSKPKGFIVKKNIKNFMLVKKGSVIGHNPKTKKKIFAEESFYPVLFGNNSYKTIFGFSARKIKKI